MGPSVENPLTAINMASPAARQVAAHFAPDHATAFIECRRIAAAAHSGQHQLN
jgi:hypothetical protein